MEEENMKDLLSSIHCQFCGRHCLTDNIGLEERNGDYWVFSVYCDSCKKYGFVTAVVRKDEEPGPHPELTSDEMNEFGMPVSADDILDIHVFLKDFHGDFLSLFPDVKPTGYPVSHLEPEA